MNKEVNQCLDYNLSLLISRLTLDPDWLLFLLKEGYRFSFPDSSLLLLEGLLGGADSLILSPGNEFNSWQKESTYSNSE